MAAQGARADNPTALYITVRTCGQYGHDKSHGEHDEIHGNHDKSHGGHGKSHGNHDKSRGLHDLSHALHVLSHARRAFWHGFTRFSLARKFTSKRREIKFSI
jgi:hypothetical protein